MYVQNRINDCTYIDNTKQRVYNDDKGVKTMEKKTERLNIRVTPEFTQKLTDLSKLWGINKTSVLSRLVFLEWQRSTDVGKKEIADALNQFEGLTETLNSLVNKSTQ